MKATAARRTSRAPRGRKFGRVAALAEGLGRVGEAQDRTDLIAQEDDGDGEQHQRRSDHPEQEDFRVRGVGRAARRKNAHHRIVELDAYFDQRRLSHRVDPERPLDLAQFDRKRLVEQREKRLWARWRHFGCGQEVDHKPEPVLGDAPELRILRVLRIAAIDIDQRRNVGHHRGRQFLRHRIPVPLHEHERHHRLQDHHRCNDDEQGARIEPGRHEALDGLAEPLIGEMDPVGDRTDGRDAEFQTGHRSLAVRSIATLSVVRSFPRKREIRFYQFWVPAFAGTSGFF